MSQRMKSMLAKTQGLNALMKSVSAESAQDEAVGSILEVVVPISQSEIFNCAWYTPTTIKGFTEKSPAIAGLAQATRVFWELPWPNTLEKSSG
jgi:hypothetical protein